MVKNNKGFTLIEVIVTVVILGIVTLIAFPMISNLSSTLNDKKYDSYNKSIESAAKLYTDSNSIDMFGYYIYGCYKIPYSVLKSKNLIKDIEDKKSDCSNDSGTYVYVIKMGEHYLYQSSIVCVDSHGNEVYNNSNITSSTCTTDITDGAPQIVLNPNSSLPVKKLNIGVQLRGSYGYGLNQKVEYEWLDSGKNPIGVNGVISYKNVPQQTELPLLSKTISSPENLTGTYYLKITPINVSNYIEQDFNNNEYVSGEYIFDNIPPTINASSDINKSSNNLSITLSDNIKLKKYVITNSNTVPSSSDSGWISVGNVKDYSTEVTKSTGYYYIHCLDAAGNLKTIGIDVKVDNPTAPVITGSPNGWKNMNRIVWIATPTSTLTSVVKYQYCKSNTNSSSGCTWTDLYNNTNGVTASGLNDVAFYHSRYSDLTNAFLGDVNGLNTHYNTYGRNEGRVTSDGSWLRVSHNFSDQGKYYVFFRAYTSGGLYSPASNGVLIQIDKTKPALTSYSVWSQRGGYNDRYIYTKPVGSDTGGSGLYQVCWSFSNSYSGTCSTTNGYTFSGDTGYNTGSGSTRGVYFYARDGAGNVSQIYGTSYQVYSSCSMTRINCNYGWDDRVYRPETVPHGNGWGKKGRYCWVIDTVHESRGNLYKCSETLRTCPHDAWCDRDGRTNIPFDTTNWDNLKHWQGYGGTCSVPFCESVLCANDACWDASYY